MQAVSKGTKTTHTVSNIQPPANPITAAAQQSLQSPKAQPKYKCDFCAAKITLAQSLVACKCKKVFCEKHTPPKTHECTFDYKTPSPKTPTRQNSFHGGDFSNNAAY